jgi:hypothetical protein
VNDGSTDEAWPLDEAIAELVAQGYVVQESGVTFTTLRRPREFSWRRCVMLLGVFYLPYFLRQSDEIVHLHRGADGEIYRLG